MDSRSTSPSAHGSWHCKPPGPGAAVTGTVWKCLLPPSPLMWCTWSRGTHELHGALDARQRSNRISRREATKRKRRAGVETRAWPADRNNSPLLLCPLRPSSRRRRRRHAETPQLRSAPNRNDAGVTAVGLVCFFVRLRRLRTAGMLVSTAPVTRPLELFFFFVAPFRDTAVYTSHKKSSHGKGPLFTSDDEPILAVPYSKIKL